LNVLDLRGRRPVRHSGRCGSCSGPVPAPGSVIRTPIPDDDHGIRFEIDRMVDYVRHFSGDPLVLKTARRVVELCEAKDKLCEISVIFEWVKEHYRYVSDPVLKEAVQTPVSMINDIMSPPELLRAILGEELVARINGFGVGQSLLGLRTNRLVASSCFEKRIDGFHLRASEDCDSVAVLLASLLAAIGIVPRFRFGGFRRGNGCSYHHVWVQAWLPSKGKWIDLDATEEGSKVGWFFNGFECTGYVLIFPEVDVGKS